MKRKIKKIAALTLSVVLVSSTALTPFPDRGSKSGMLDCLPSHH